MHQDQNDRYESLPSPDPHNWSQQQRQDCIRAYFSRLDLTVTDPPARCSKQLLDQLQYAHVTRIPYENLAILNGSALPMTFDGQFCKMILKRQGGYCFELNGVFAGLLKALGYQVTTYMSRYLRGEAAVPMRRHRVLRVTCHDGTFICDTGVGQQAPRHPLVLIPDLVQEQFGETYQIRREPFFGWVIYDLYKGNWRPFYSFTEEEQLELDFVMPSFYCEKSPDSIFNKSLMLSIKTQDGRKTIDGNLYRVFSAHGVDETVIASPAELVRLLDEQFNLEPPSLKQAQAYLSLGASVRK